ncbi:hypothetical protein, partial [Gordonibacter pamelaeae]|uniref:hypothetical protein n=1 Tax=Gordonibacter pamelaeae TaxID=471189 RepID=UPI003A8F84CC
MDEATVALIDRIAEGGLAGTVPPKADVVRLLALDLTISPLLLRHSKHRCYSVPRLADTPQREELTRAPQGARPFPAKSRWARRAPLAIERKGEGNGQVQGDPQAEGHGDKHQEHRVLVRV